MELKNIRKEPVRNEDYITERKTTFQGSNSRIDEAEDQIRDLEGKEAENTQSEQQKYLAIVNCAAMNIGVHRFFWIGVSGFLGYNCSSGIAGSKAVPF